PRNSIRVYLCSSVVFLIFSIFGVAGVELTIDSSKLGAEIDLTRYALGQGGLSDKPMFDSHVEQIGQLHPQTIRIFVQEFFELNPKPGQYHWATLDNVIETILKTRAKPILCLCFKPKTLFPKIDQTVVHPTDYKQWEELIYQLVRHCNTKKRFGIQYWEVSNEPDIGEDGGCPYLFQAPDYVVYYTHTVSAILRADPKAKVGGPALAGYNSDIGTALIEHCGKGQIPLHFFSWHVYHSDPGYFRKSIREVKGRLAKFPKLKATETMITEWNMSLDQPARDPGFQPAFVLETTLGFLEEGLTGGAYYHIRDWFVGETQFSRFMSPKGAAFVARWWNDTPQYDGLYDNQGRVRPAYYSFKLLSLIKGRQIAISGATPEVKGFAVRSGAQINLVVWNFPPSGPGASQEVTLRFTANKTGQFRVTRLNPTSPLIQLELERQGDVAELQDKPVRFTLQPHAIRRVAISE
ncbi:MAG: xylan 1,4-beta-xylosidase, partial [Verrucomicrobiota bacterium]